MSEPCPAWEGLRDTLRKFWEVAWLGKINWDFCCREASKAKPGMKRAQMCS